MSKVVRFALAAVLAASAGVPAFAASPDNPAAQQSADHDFGKLSVDGGDALRDIRLVRLEIFNGDIKGAKADLAKAVASLDRAKSDETVFTKAEADLKAPASMQANKTQTSSNTQTHENASTTPIQWLPVDGSMTLGEDYIATPEKAASVAKANEKLASGDQKAALDALKVADLDVSFAVEVAPLKATIEGVQQASTFLNEGKYYEANQALKTVEDGMRYDSETFVAAPQKVGNAHDMKSSG
jgi:hypothetical protein